MLRNNKNGRDLILLILLWIAIIGMFWKNEKIQEQEECIQQLKQNQAEQQEEKDYYINRCKMLEQQLLDNGLVVDSCECY